MRKFAVAFAALFMLVVVPNAFAAPPSSIFNGTIPCTTVGDGRTVCQGPGGDTNATPGVNNAVANTVPSWDGTPIDVTVVPFDASTSAPVPYRWPCTSTVSAAAGCRRRPQTVHRSGVRRLLDDRARLQVLLRQAERDHRPEQRHPDACDKGFIHLMDTRYEVRGCSTSPACSPTRI